MKIRWILVILALFAGFCLDAKPADYNDFETNPYLTISMRQRIRPFILPAGHPMKKALDSIFHASRATKDVKSLSDAGFKVLFKQKRSFICVVKHPQLPGYLLKLYTDDEIRQKHDTPSWECLARRCEGARKIRNVIKNNGLVHFQAPQKWLYPLPLEPSPSQNCIYARHPVVLIVEDMKLVSKKENLYVWENMITKEHLDELFLIITLAKGSSYRPDNIPYSKNGKFSFIDTEYPLRPTDYISIRRYLSKKMCRYWDDLLPIGTLK